MVKNLLANAGDVRDTGLIPRSGRSPGGGHDNPLQYSCLENPMHRGVWQDTVHRVTKSWTRLMQLSTQSCGCRHISDMSLGPQHLLWHRLRKHCAYPPYTKEKTEAREVKWLFQGHGASKLPNWDVWFPDAKAALSSTAQLAASWKLLPMARSSAILAG